MKTALNMAKIGLKQTKISYYIVGVVLLLSIAGDIITTAILGPGSDNTIAVGDYLYLLPLLLAILIPARHFTKLMNLGGQRVDFFKSCIMAYLSVIAIVTLVSTVLYPTLYPLLLNSGMDIIILMDVFGFWAHGPVLAFIQMFAFLTLSCCVLHTLTLIQGRWYGWVVDVLIIAIISIFTPYASLRVALAWFFNLIIFHNDAIVQILLCLILGAAVYSASLIPIKSKQI